MFNVYLLASGASEFSPERRKALLLHSLGPEGQRIFNTLSISQAAEKAEEKGTGATPDVYDSTVAALAKHFDATCNLVVERHRFHSRIQFPGESIQEYVTALTELAAMCSFMSQEESLHDQFVAGVSSHRIRERLLLEGSSLSFNKAVALGSQIEQAAVCGSKQHRASWKRCPAKGKKCFFCGRFGHFENVCIQKRSQEVVHEVSARCLTNISLVCRFFLFLV
ncbi:uncharacterized protein LOC142775055 [Rhipicephalus microplus]|uniref:uncharacterized protein LOC142775055 n=1 Tax=Rhipicephalus microplus TaxID=6941 RepID=UPI003F6BDA9D